MDEIRDSGSEGAGEGEVAQVGPSSAAGRSYDGLSMRRARSASTSSSPPTANYLPTRPAVGGQ
jgi:hypothetical protein